MLRIHTKCMQRVNSYSAHAHDVGSDDTTRLHPDTGEFLNPLNPKP